MTRKNEKMESLLIIVFFYTFVIISAILVTTRFNELSKKGYENNISASNQIINQ